MSNVRRVIALSVEIFVCLFVDTKNEHFERSRPVYELYVQRMSRKCENIIASMYLKIESDLRRAQKS